MKTVDDIKNVLAVGAGTLGLRIALRCALDGYNVKLYDISNTQLEVAQDTHAYLIKGLLKRGQITDEMVVLAKQNLTMTSDLNEAITGVDLISESIIENIDIKKEFYTDLTPRLPEGVIVTTNTSYLLPSMMLESIKHPDHFCAFHFHDVFNQTVVDVMPHPDTAPWVSDLLMEFGRRINQIPVFIKKENSGYIYNTMLMALQGQAGHLLVNDVGSIQDIDRSFMGNFKVSVGPFGMFDMIGLDTALHIVGSLSDPKSKRFAELLKTYVDAGNLGFKTGEGFYKYPNPEYSHPNFLKA